MKNLAPDITRQRLLVEGYYGRSIARKDIVAYFRLITEKLNLRMYGKPIIFSPAGMGKKQNQGYDAFVPLIDSGISLYVWSNAKFFSAVIYTCKSFDEKAAIETTKRFFRSDEVVHLSF